VFDLVILRMLTVFPKKKIQARAWQQLRNVAVKGFKMMSTHCYI
jgi:hypothetical protein